MVKVPDQDALRPTGARVRETLFNWLAPEIEGARCLDLFAGSGVLGLEAASRGAGRVVMIDIDATVTSHLTQEATRLGSAGIEVLRQDAFEMLRVTHECFDIVFVDPPFRRGLVQKALTALSGSGALADSALLYIEIESTADDPELPDGWAVHRDKCAGQVRFMLIRTGKKG